MNGGDLDGCEPTLGELLGVFFSSVDLPTQSARTLHEEARFCAARTLSAELAAICPTTFDAVLDALCYVPDDLLPLLESPQGWEALSGVVTRDLGLPVITYHPTIH